MGFPQGCWVQTEGSAADSKGPSGQEWPEAREACGQTARCSGKKQVGGRARGLRD